MFGKVFKTYSKMMLKPSTNFMKNKNMFLVQNKLSGFSIQQQQIREKVSTVYKKKMKEQIYKNSKYKLKTKSSLNKRLRQKKKKKNNSKKIFSFINRLTGSGKIKLRKPGKRHLAWNKSNKRLNRLSKWSYIESGKLRKNLLKMMYTGK